MERLIRASLNTWRGLKSAWASEQAFRQEVYILVPAVPLAIWLGDTWGDTALLIGMVLLVMVAELLNTAVEKLADHVTPEHHPTIGRVKDLGSAAVGLALVAALLVWGAALLDLVT
jgi:diacylglycerol kinase (ATP)